MPIVPAITTLLTGGKTDEERAAANAADAQAAQAAQDAKNAADAQASKDALAAEAERVPYAETAGTGVSQAKVQMSADDYTALGKTASDSTPTTQSEYIAPDAKISGITTNEDGTSKLAGEDYFTAETKVAKQLEGLLAKDSALSQQSRRKAREGASALGMMSSSTAVGDAQARNVEALLPVAQQDAETASKFKLQQQQIENSIKEIQVEAEVSGKLTVQKAEIAEKKLRVEQEWQAMFQSVDVEAQGALAELQASLSKEQRLLEADLQKEISQMEIDAGMEQLIINRTSDANANFSSSLLTLMGTESWVDLFNDKEKSPEENNAAMRSWVDNMYQSSVVSPARFTARAAGIYDPTEGGGMKAYIDDMSYAHVW